MSIFEGLRVAVTGFLIVFFILIILMVVIFMFKFLFGKKEKNSNSETDAITESSENANNTVKPKSISEKKLVAIATAAIAASRGSSDCAFDVLSITKIS